MQPDLSKSSSGSAASGNVTMDEMKVLALDWGTTSLRAFAMAEDGAILDRRRAEAGIRAIDDGDFEDAFFQVVGDWLPPDPEAAPLIVMGGMIGSRQGWIEAPYLPCPADPAALAAEAIRGEMRSGQGFWIAPGLSTVQDGRADVMRGEELQILGALEQLGGGRHLICLPGTHSKWVEVEDGIIRNFRTYMTGELFDLLRRHSILGTTIEHAAWSDEGFREGLAAAMADGGLMAQLFTVRAGHLLGTLPVEKSGAYLSGLLIGSEVYSAVHTLPAGSEVCVIGNPDLTDLYIPAVADRDIRFRPLGEYTGAHGLFRLAKDLLARR